jgi:hypothetical protein
MSVQSTANAVALVEGLLAIILLAVLVLCAVDAFAAVFASWEPAGG